MAHITDLSLLYKDTESESQRLQSFANDLSADVTGYMHQTADDLTGIPEYIGDIVGEEDLQTNIQTAEDSLAFIEARNGQLAYAVEIMSVQDHNHIELEDRSLTPGEAVTEFNDRIRAFNEYERDIVDAVETVTYSEDTPFESFDFEEAREIPDFQIDDWQWPRENLWPFENVSN